MTDELRRLLDDYRDAVADRAHAGAGMGSGIAAHAEGEARAALDAYLVAFCGHAADEGAKRVAALVLAEAEGLEGFAGRWMIYTTAHHADGGEVYLWWRPEAAGYTTRLDMAGRYTDDELARRGFNRVGPGLFGKWRDRVAGVGDFAVRAEDALRVAGRVVEVGKLPKVEGARW